MIAWIASFLPVGSIYTRAGAQTEREYFSQISFNLTRGFSFDPGRYGRVQIHENPIV
jgi:hypothetical protein